MTQEQYPHSLRRHRIRLLYESFGKKGIKIWRDQLDPLKVGDPHYVSRIDYQTKCHVFELNGDVVHVPLDYYFQPHQEWLAESIVTEYILCNYQHTPAYYTLVYQGIYQLV